MNVENPQQSQFDSVAELEKLRAQLGKLEAALMPFLRALEEQEAGQRLEMDDDGCTDTLSDYATLTGGPFGCRLTVKHARALRTALRSGQ